MKIAILGSTGMLGNSVKEHFSKIKNYTILATNREMFDAKNPEFSILEGFDYVINCIGIIKPYMNLNICENIYINSIFPRKLADWCKNNSVKLIHITTDCVYSGKDGNYSETSFHDCIDEYGKSKSLGEPLNCMVIRTSIIGEEKFHNASLISWIKSMKSKTVNGFVNHLWNGITTNHYAELCQQIIDKNLYEEGTFHIFSNIVNKAQLIEMINEKFNLNIKIEKIEDKNSIDRTLCSKKNLVNKLNIKSLTQQIQEL